VTLALQGYFLRLPHHPVPGLLIYDQPSQVYFPARRTESLTADASEPEWKNEDVVAVRKVFALFDHVIKRTDGRMQIIVLDHADEEVWGELENVHRVEVWRGRGLVPSAWYSPP
jgi:hypothetical protein